MVENLSLGCVEFAVPGNTLEDKLESLESRNMWLELVNDGDRKIEDISDALSSFETPVKTIQANLLHKLKMLSDSKLKHNAAVRHVEETIRLASAVGARNVVTTLAYGQPSARNPRRIAVETYKKFGRLAKEFDVTVSIESLGKNRTTFLPGMSDVYDLIREVDSAHVCLMADTMHIHDNGDEICDVIAKYIDEISELQLRDTDSRPPGKGNIDFEKAMKVIGKKFKGLICLEYKPSPDLKMDFIQACDFVSGLISAAR